jgi:hypothetical protein
MTPAAEVYRVAGEDRPRRAWRWALTALMALFNAGDVPAVSQVVIRRVADDSVVRRIDDGWATDFEARLRAAASDLDEMDAVTFARAWIALPGS